MSRGVGRRLQLAVSLLALLVGTLSLGPVHADSSLVNLSSPPRLDVNAHRFADSCLVDFSGTLAPPAGQYGFLSVSPDGHFVFAEGQRVRFWGINVAKDAVFQPHSTIDAAAQLFARVGFNLVRLHHLDDVGGLLAGLAKMGDTSCQKQSAEASRSVIRCY